MGFAAQISITFKLPFQAGLKCGWMGVSGGQWAIAA